MDKNGINRLIQKISTLHPDAEIRIMIDYHEDIDKFLRDQGYGFLIQEDAFGVQILVVNCDYIKDNLN